MKTYVMTPAAGKRLMAKAMTKHPAVRGAMEKGTLVIVAGTTNGYIAEVLLAAIGAAEGVNRRLFFRGVTLPPAPERAETGRPTDEGVFPGDVVIAKGVWQKGKTIFDVAEELKEGDVILKGANAVDLARRQAAVLIGHPQGGTLAATMAACVGRRVRLILPVGLEKRVPGDLVELAARMNRPGAHGPRLWPVPGDVFTEIDALALLTGAHAEIVAAGGVGGAEGAVWLAVSGTPEQEAAAQAVLSSVVAEPRFGG